MQASSDRGASRRSIARAGRGSPTARARRQQRIASAALSLAALLGAPAAARAATYGVPTNLDAQGLPTATSVNPPGWFTIKGATAGAGQGDVVHQVRLFIEVTATTLDIRIFDPGNSLTRDEIVGGSNTMYELFSPSGASVCCSITISSEGGVMSGTTDNRLVRFTPAGAGFYQLDDPNSNNVHFSGLSRGLYEFRVSETSNDDTNAFGVDIRVSSTNAAHYNVYTIGQTPAQDSAMIIGRLTQGSNPAAITQPMVFHPYVSRGCTVQTSNFDADTQGPATLTDVLGAATGLTISAGTVHSENTATVEASPTTRAPARTWWTGGLRTSTRGPTTRPTPQGTPRTRSACTCPTPTRQSSATRTPRRRPSRSWPRAPVSSAARTRRPRG
jgi:hypothetical protein